MAEEATEQSANTAAPTTQPVQMVMVPASTVQVPNAQNPPSQYQITQPANPQLMAAPAPQAPVVYQVAPASAQAQVEPQVSADQIAKIVKDAFEAQAATEPEPDPAPADPPAPEADPAPTIDPTAIYEAAKARTNLIVRVQALLPEDFDPHEATDREIVLAALGDGASADSDDSYLNGQLDFMLKSRTKASEEQKNLKDSVKPSANQPSAGGSAGTDQQMTPEQAYQLSKRQLNDAWKTAGTT